jgi:hypothetical protein
MTGDTLGSAGGSSAALSIPTMSGPFTVWSSVCNGATRLTSYRLSKQSSPQLWPRSTSRSPRYACAGPRSISPKSAALRHETVWSGVYFWTSRCMSNSLLTGPKFPVPGARIPCSDRGCCGATMPKGAGGIRTFHVPPSRGQQELPVIFPVSRELSWRMVRA